MTGPGYVIAGGQRELDVTYRLQGWQPSAAAFHLGQRPENAPGKFSGLIIDDLDADLGQATPEVERDPIIETLHDT